MNNHLPNCECAMFKEAGIISNKCVSAPVNAQKEITHILPDKCISSRTPVDEVWNLQQVKQYFFLHLD